MERKYLILKSNGCNGYWSYMGKEKTYNQPITKSVFFDRFVCVDVADAVQFDTKEDAEIFISKLGMNGKTFFKIEEVYVVQ